MGGSSSKQVSPEPTGVSTGRGKDVSADVTLGPRPRHAAGKFLRILTINDCYKLDHYPRVAAAVEAAKAEADSLGCVVTSHLNGDFLSPCTITAIDGGQAMTEALNQAKIDYVMLGNHEFDFGFDVPVARMQAFNGKCVNGNIENAPINSLPRYDVVKVGDKNVVITGLLTEDTSIYAPSNTPTITKPSEAAVKVWEEAKASLGKKPDLFVPMTHMLVPEDKKTAVEIAKHAELAACTPVVLGGHEHDMYVDEAGKSTIVKVGQDAERLGVVDVWWTADGAVHSKVTVLPITEFDEDATAKAFVQAKHDFLTQMMAASIADVPAAMSSKKVRFEPSGVATFLLTFVQRNLKKQADLAMVQGGFVRYKKDYEPGEFTMGDLFGEFAFEGPFCVIPLKGEIIQQSTAATRSAPKPAPNFLHFSEGVVVEGDAHTIVSVGGAPFDPEKIYQVAIYHHLLTGLNVIEPLMSYVSAHVQVPDVEACRPVKDLVLEVCMKDEWRRLIGYDHFDADGDGDVSHEELQAGLDKAISKMDKNGDGLVSRDELAQYIHAIGGNTALVEKLLQALDADGDGQISRAEFQALAF